MNKRNYVSFEDKTLKEYVQTRYDMATVELVLKESMELKHSRIEQEVHLIQMVENEDRIVF